MAKLILGDGDYGFLSSTQLPNKEYTEKTIPLNSSKLAVTGDFNNIAKNHCGAVCALNIASVLSQKEPRLLIEGDCVKSFKAIHKIIGSGPTPSIAKGLSAYARRCGASLKYQSEIKCFEDIKDAADRGNPCGILLANAPADWHWVMCVGYREYQNEDGFIRICDGWHRNADRFYTNNRLNCG
ncbi:MAG: hypothetical protein NC203_08155 [Firmicutes bacterium]|nr:hypothetical protein [[Eubacterium] siraeum]MCM1488322.1 hypothetical protein [Bacillota bacterium]